MSIRYMTLISLLVVGIAASAQQQALDIACQAPCRTTITINGLPSNPLNHNSLTIMWYEPAPPTPGWLGQITAYNIYKSTVPGGEVIGQPYATVSASSLFFTDKNVTLGQPVYYKATSVCEICLARESAFSQEWKAIVK